MNQNLSEQQFRRLNTSGVLPNSSFKPITPHDKGAGGGRRVTVYGPTQGTLPMPISTNLRERSMGLN